MTGQRVLIIVALMFTLVAGFLLLGVGREDEPVYQGKPLREWVERLAVGNGANRVEAVEALHRLGTNALPPLVEMLRARDSALRENLRLAASLQTWVNVPLSRASNQRFRAVAAFEALGPAARPALPALVKLLHQAENPMDVARVLAALGPEAILPLAGALAHENEEVRSAAACGLGMLRSDAGAVVPVLVKTLQDPDYAVRFYAARSLFHVHEEPALAVPALMERLSDTNALVRRYAANALGAYGQKAGMAVPALVKNGSDPDWNARRAAFYALQRIDPETAARQGPP